MKKWYNLQLSDHQQSFKQGRGTIDGIYITKRVQQVSDQMQMPIFVLLVDLNSAFDHVVRKWLFQSIYMRFPNNAKTTCIQILESIYEHTTTALSETPKDKFTTSSGVRQGGPENPFLFN